MQTFSADLVKAKFYRKLIAYIIFLAKNFLKYWIAADLLDSKYFNLSFHSKMYLPYQMNNVHELYFQKWAKLKH